MKLALLAALLLCASACSVKQVHVIKQDGTEVRVSWSSLFRDDSADGFSYGRSDKDVLLELGQLGSKTDGEQIKALADFMVKGAIPPP